MIETQARAMLPEWSKARTERKVSIQMSNFAERFIRNHMITILLIAAMIVEGVIVGSTTAHNVRVETEERMRAEYAAELEAYKAEQAYQAQAEHWLSGDASREAFINQEITAAAKAISKEANDQVKGTKLGVGLARVINQYYPGTIKEVFAQKDQFMFIDDSNTYTQHDWDLAESIIRPYYEDGIIPQGLTENMVYFEWNGSTATARDSYQTTTGMSTWRYNG